MAKRFFATDIWKEDWFLDIPTEYKLFWFYILSACDQAGVFKINIRTFCVSNNVEIDINQAFTYFNNGKERIRKINGSSWLIEDFFSFQYGQTLNLNNRVHKSIEEIYGKVGVSVGSIRGLKEVKKETDKGQGKS